MRRRAALLLALAVLPSCSRTRDTRANVLLISLDSVRRDMLGCYGGSFAGRSPSPNLDQLAAQGVRIEDALSGTSWTLPAHATLFTGQPELVHGVEQDGQRLGDEFPTLAERLHDSGYRTAGVYSGPYLDPRFGFGRGFERYRAGYGPELAAAAQAASAALARVHALGDSSSRGESTDVLQANARAEQALELASHRDSSSRTVSALLLEELDAATQDGRPFFLFAHYFDPHYDYVPPDVLAREFDPGYEGALDGRDFAGRLVAPEVSAGDLAHLRTLHAAELAWTDAEIGRVLDELERRGLAENTLVVVVADHGEEFLEHGGLGHRRTLFPEVVRVPVILRWPAGLPAGQMQPGPSSLAEVAPSVLALVEGAGQRAPLLARAGDGAVLGRLVLSPTGELDDVRVLESFRQRGIAILRECPLDPSGAETLRWIDRELHPDEPESGWSADFTSTAAEQALRAFRAEHARLVAARREAPRAEKADDLLAAFRGLGYASEEARVGALDDEALVLPPPGEHVRAGEKK